MSSEVTLLPNSAAQSWMFGTYAVLTLMTRRAPRHDKLGGAVKNAETTRVTRTILANSWGVESRESLMETLTGLRDGGERKGRTPDAADGLGPRGLLAWDLIRLNAVAAWGYVADFITEEEAFSFIIPASKELQKSYTSWEDLGEAYVKAIHAWDAHAGKDGEGFFEKLTTDPASPWKTVPWSTPLDGDATSPAAAPRSFLGMSTYLLIPVVVAILGAALGIAVLVKRSRAATPVVWDGQSQFKCSGDDTPSLIDRKARIEGKPLILASGNCHLTIKGSNLLGVVAVLAEGDAVVDVEGGVLAGSPNAVNASGNSRVNLHGTRIIGLLHKSGNAEITGP